MTTAADDRDDKYHSYPTGAEPICEVYDNGTWYDGNLRARRWHPVKGWEYFTNWTTAPGSTYTSWKHEHFIRNVRDE